MYNAYFCRVYDEFGWNEYPRIFAEQLLRWLEQRGLTLRSALDLGCGTGVLCQVLHQSGIDTLGVDLSGEMIAISRQRAPGLHYEVADMVSFNPKRTFDLITCTGDALNHLTDFSRVVALFRRAHDVLNPGGLLIFDLLKDEEVPSGEPFEADFSEHLRVRFSTRRDDEGFTALQIDGFEDGHPAFTETIREKLHPIHQVIDALRETGFKILKCDDRFFTEESQGTTWIIVAQA